jgi:hypothetical protein
LDCRTNFAEDDGYATGENLILFQFSNFVWIRFPGAGLRIIGCVKVVPPMMMVLASQTVVDSEGQGFTFKQWW